MEDLVTDNPAILVYQLTYREESEASRFWEEHWDLWTDLEKRDWLDWVLDRGRWGE